MSLNTSQKAITSQELKENYKIADLGETQVLRDLGFSENQLREALNVSDRTNGYDVWRLRDYLVEIIREQGKEAVPFSILKTNVWFQYKKASFGEYSPHRLR